MSTNLCSSGSRHHLLLERAPEPHPAAFTLRNLSQLSYSNGFTLWSYRSDDLSRVLRPGFFGAAGDLISPGDVVICTSADRVFQVAIDRDRNARMMLAAAEERAA